MKKTVIDALWDKIGDIFVSKTQLSTGMNTKLDVLTAGRGISISNNVISSTVTEEVVTIWITSEVTGFDVEGLTMNVYFNDGEVPYTTTTNENGIATITIPHDFKYKIVFPIIEGCKEIPSVIHLATANERSIEIEYEELPTPEVISERLTLTVLKKSGTSYIAAENVTVTVTYDNETLQLTSGNDGKVIFTIPYGKTYTITMPSMLDYYILNSSAVQTFYANRTTRYITVRYHDPLSGLFIVDSEGNEYTPDEWVNEIDNNTKQQSDAVAIKIATQALINAGGVFAIDIDMIRNRTYNSGLRWCASNVLFTSIPENGNNSSATNYYNGLAASKLILTEGNERNLDTPAVDYCLNLTLTINGINHEGFLGSVGLWALLWTNVTAIDEILEMTRPEGALLLSSVITNKWSSTLFSANSAWNWTTSALNSSFKYTSYAVVPFFAF